MAGILTATGGYWLLTSTSGLQWLLSTVSRTSAGSLSFEGVHGTLRTMRLDSIHFNSPDLQLTVQDIKLDWQPGALLAGKLSILVVSAKNIEVHVKPSDTPSILPESLRLPVAVSILKLHVATLRLFTKEGDEPDFAATALSAKLESDGKQHDLSTLQFISKLGKLNASAKIDGNRPFNLTAQGRLAGQTELDTNQLSKVNIFTTITGNLEQLNTKLEGKIAGVNADMVAQLRPYAALPIGAIRISVDGFNPKIFASDAPKANLTLHADLHEQDETGPLSGNLVVKNNIAGTYDSNHLPLSEVSTRLTLTAELLQLDDLLLHLADNGIMSGNISWRLKQSSGFADLIVSQLNPKALDSRLRSARVSGQIKLNGNKQTQQAIVTLKDDTLNLNAQVVSTAETIALESLHLSRGRSQLSGQGKLDLINQKPFSFSGNLKHFNLADFLQAPFSDLNSSLKLTGNLSPQVAGTVKFQITNSLLEEHPVTGNGHIEFNDSNQLKSKVNLLVGSNRLRIEGDFGSPGDSIQLDIAAPALAQIGLGLNGSLHTQAKLSGNFNDPNIKFKINVENIDLKEKHYISRLNANGELYDEKITLKLDADNYRIEKEKQFQHLNINVTGERSLHSIKAEAHVSDQIKIQLHTNGGLSTPTKANPALQWIGQLSQLSVTGALPFHLLTPTSLELSSKNVLLGSAKFSMAGGHANIEVAQWTPKMWMSQGDFTGLALHPIGDHAKKQQALYLGGKWNITSAKHLTGRLLIAREKGDWILPGKSPLPIKLQTLQFNAKAFDGEIAGELSLISERLGKVDARFTLPLIQSGASWTIMPSAPLNGQITMNLADISWIGSILDDSIKSKGQIDLQASLSGTFEKPKLEGKVYGEDLNLALLDHGVRLEQGQLVANFNQSSLHVKKLDFSSPYEPPPKDQLLDNLKLPKKSGSLAISGTIGLFGKDSDLNIKLDHLLIAHQSNYWIVASGSSYAKLSNQILTLGGKITADAGLLTQPSAGQPQLSDDIVVIGQTQAETQDDSLDLDAILDLGEHFYLRASGLEGRLAGQLRLQSATKQGLHVTGSIATHNAIYKAYGQKLEVKRGIVNFNGPIDDPGLNVLAVRTKLPVEAGVEVIGTVQRPKVRLVSTPNVPDSEKLSWIVLGRSPNTSGMDTSLLLTAAESILGGAGGGITEQISDALGVDEISVRQADKSSSLTGQIGTIGKRLSSRAYISYERGLTTATIGVTKLTYTLTPKISIVTQAGEDSAVDLFYTLQFD